MTVQDIFDFLNSKYPVETACGFDNVGTLVGDNAIRIELKASQMATEPWGTRVRGVARREMVKVGLTLPSWECPTAKVWKYT